MLKSNSLVMNTITKLLALCSQILRMWRQSRLEMKQPPSFSVTVNRACVLAFTPRSLRSKGKPVLIEQSLTRNSIDRQDFPFRIVGTGLNCPTLKDQG